MAAAALFVWEETGTERVGVSAVLRVGGEEV